MKNFLVEESERIEILKRHKLVVEQKTNQSYQIIKAGYDAGCFGQKGNQTYFAIVEAPVGSGNYVFQKDTNDALMKSQGFIVVRIRPDNQYYYYKPPKNGGPQFTQPRPLLNPCTAMTNFGKKTEDQVNNDYLIKLAKDAGFLELAELRTKGEDITEINNSAVWEKKGPYGNVVLYKRRGTASGGMDQKDAQRKEWIGKLDGLGYEVNPNDVDKETMIPVRLYGQKIPGLPEGLFPAEQIVYIRKGQTTGSRLAQSEKDQDVDRKTCKDRIENFYNKFIYSKGRPITDVTTLNIAKDEAQFCKNKYEGKWGIGGGKYDEMIQLLSGRKTGGPTSSGDDSIFRLN